MATGYTDPGSYGGGVWLVAFPNGSAGLYGKGQLPPPDGKVQYYWLGANTQQINSRILSALHKFPQTSNTEAIPQLDQSMLDAITGGSPLGISGSTPKPSAPGAKYNDGPLGFLGGIGDAINSVTDFLKLISWLFHPRNIVRAIEFVVGMILFMFGLHAAMQARGERISGFSGEGEYVLSRSGVGRVASSLADAARGQGGGRSGRRPTPRAAPHRERAQAPRRREARQNRQLDVSEARERRLATQQKARLDKKGGKRGSRY